LAEFLYEQANPATDHPYLDAKQIQPQDSRVDSHANLVMPFTDKAGQIQTVQFINQAGKKRFLSKAKNNGQGVKGAAYRIDGTTDTAYVCEGAATGHSIHEATGCTVYCVGGKENFRHVLPWVKTKHQTVVVAADNDKSSGTA
jgi:putative DNA primase/helicase